MPTLDEYEIKKAVKVAVGFDSTRVQNGQHNTPWQILLTLTRKTIAKEDGLANIRDASHGLFAPMDMLLEWQDLAMTNWYELYPKKLPSQSRRKDRNFSIEENDDLEYPRHILGIAYYTNDLHQATEKLNVNDTSFTGARLSKDKWQRAHYGWNKKDKCIVVVQDTREMIMLASRHRFSFGPLLTAWLAAMAPHAKYRLLVIRHAIKMLTDFYAGDGDKNQEKALMLPRPPIFETGDNVDTMNEWYAFHTLRRMFRMCFGCNMFQHQDRSSGSVEWVETIEPPGSLQNYDLKEDRAWQTYKKTVKPLLKKFEKS